MRVAALYDIHGNLPALEAVVREARAAGVGRVVIGGDVLPGPMPRECLDVVLDLDIPTDFIIGARVVNAGSVGMPFDAPGAYWLLLDSGIELRRTDYDLERAADRVRRTGCPQAEVFAINNILSPPSKQMMTEAFSKAELS